jgi:hypothetical protein
MLEIVWRQDASLSSGVTPNPTLRHSQQDVPTIGFIDRRNPMIVVCAWCQADQGTKEPLDNLMVSHGICPDCFKEMAKEVEKPLPAAMNEEFFDSFYEELGVKNPRNLRTQTAVV